MGRARQIKTADGTTVLYTFPATMLFDAFPWAAGLQKWTPVQENGQRVGGQLPGAFDYAVAGYVEAPHYEALRSAVEMIHTAGGRENRRVYYNDDRYLLSRYLGLEAERVSPGSWNTLLRVTVRFRALDPRFRGDDGTIFTEP